MRQCTSSDTPVLTINDATPTHEVLANFVLDLTQPIQGADHPGDPQACTMARGLHRSIGPLTETEF